MEISNLDRRLVYQNALKLCTDRGLNVEKARPAYGFLRIEAPIRDNQSLISFPLQENQTFNGVVQIPAEKRLQQTDNFVVSSKGIFVYFLDMETLLPQCPLVTGFTPYNTPKANTFGPITPVYSDAPNNIFKNSMNGLFTDAWMKYTFDYEVPIPRYDVLQHYYVPITQATMNPAAAPPVKAETNFAWNIPSGNGLSDGFMPMEPNIVLSGAKTSDISLNMPYPINYANFGWDAADILSGKIQPRYVIMYRGILVQNSTSIR